MREKRSKIVIKSVNIPSRNRTNHFSSFEIMMMTNMCRNVYNVSFQTLGLSELEGYILSAVLYCGRNESCQGSPMGAPLVSVTSNQMEALMFSINKKIERKLNEVPRRYICFRHIRDRCVLNYVRNRPSNE